VNIHLLTTSTAGEIRRVLNGYADDFPVVLEAGCGGLCGCTYPHRGAVAKISSDDPFLPPGTPDHLLMSTEKL
jgi:hypothetical protein